MYRKFSDVVVGSETEAAAPRAKENFLNGHTNGESGGQQVESGSGGHCEGVEEQESNGIDTK